MDAQDPSVGVIIQYINGSDRFCNKIPRSLTIKLRCGNYYTIEDNVPVTEFDSCSYSFELINIFACPLECGVADRDLCSKHGVCAFDLSSRKPRCFCNSNYFGDDCRYKGSKKTFLDTTSYVLIGVIVFLFILFVVMTLIWKKVSSLRLDKTVYTQNEAGVRVQSKYEKI